ncbi:hypothetical protein [Burkholderia pyrrocinia]
MQPHPEIMKIGKFCLANIFVRESAAKEALAPTSGFAKSIASVRNSKSSINIASCNKPPGLAKVFCSNFDTSTNEISHTGFVSHFGDRQEPALFVHATKDWNSGKTWFAYQKGIYRDGIDAFGCDLSNSTKLLDSTGLTKALKEDFGIDLSEAGGREKPLHLIACRSGGRDAKCLASELAKAINRKVVSYGDGEILYAPYDMKLALTNGGQVYSSSGKWLFSGTLTRIRHMHLAREVTHTPN